MSRSNLRPYAEATAMVAACLTVGTIASDPDSRWYRHLNKPSWNPPNTAFPIAWTLLYADVAVAGGTALAALDGPAKDAYRRALARNLLLNAGWSAAFFRAHRMGFATVWAGVLAADSAGLARRTAKANEPAGWALTPYVAWTSFATVLAGSLWRRNR